MAAEVATPVSFSAHSPRRIQRGSRYSPVVDANELNSPTPSLYSLDSAFQLQEYISQIVRRDPEDLEAIVKIPHPSLDPGTSAQDQAEVDHNCWIYEHLRRLALDLTYPLITLLQAECTRQSCPEMKAGEWLYLCVAHGNGAAMEQCCAIDYILHTLDSATALLNSSRNFPSRIAIPNTSTRHFSSLARRLSRIFAHAYFHHRELFEQSEAENALYERFLLLVQEFQLVPAEFLVIPWEERPARKSKRLQQEQDQSYDQYRDYGEPPRREEGDEYSRAPIPRAILGRSGEHEELPPDDAALMASPSGGSLARRRTDTMYLTGDLALSALGPVLGGAQEGEESIPEGGLSLEEGHTEVGRPAVEHADAEPEERTEMVESVDPFEDNTRAASAVEEVQPPVPATGVETLGDDKKVPDVENVAPAAPVEPKAADEEGKEWPDTETLEKEAEEAARNGQVKEDVVTEPPPTPAEGISEENAAVDAAAMKEEEKPKEQ